LKLLNEGKVIEFNLIRNQRGSKSLMLRGVDLQNTNLVGADLHGVDFADASLVGVKLDQANMSYANLLRASLDDVSLIKTNLQHANLSNGSLTRVDCTDTMMNGADLSYALLVNANLSGVDLTNANAFWSTIIGCKYNNKMKCDNAEFAEVIMDDDGLSMYLDDHNVKYVSPAIKDKTELQNKLKDRGYPKKTIAGLLKASLLEI
jgi:hypothetical protein